MSLREPNEYEQAIEAYAHEYRRAEQLRKEAGASALNATAAEAAKQEAWRVIHRYRNAGFIKEGIYRLKSSSTDFAEGVVIGSGDYPPIRPMFR